MTPEEIDFRITGAEWRIMAVVIYFTHPQARYAAAALFFAPSVIAFVKKLLATRAAKSTP